MSDAYDATVTEKGEPAKVPDEDTLEGEEIKSGAMVFGVRSPYDRSVIPGMTPERMGWLLSRASQGNAEDYVVLAKEMEERDGFYYSCIRTRMLAVASLPWVCEAVADDSTSQRIADECAALLKSVPFRLGLLDILDATGKGYSVCEIGWDTSAVPWVPRKFTWKNPRFFHFDRDTSEHIRVRSLEDWNGTPLLPYKYIVHTPNIRSGLAIGSGLARPCAAMHIFKSYGIRDMMVFAEVFGMPIRVGKYPLGARAEDIATLRHAVASIGTDAAAVFPDGMMIELLRASNSGLGGSDDFFTKMCDWFDRQNSMAVLGQASGSDQGGSYAKAKVQDDIRKDLRDADALQLSATVGRDLLRAYLDLNYGPTCPMPHCYPDCEEPEDLEALVAALAPMIDRGLKVEKSVISERFRLPVPEHRDAVDSDEPELLEPNIAVTKGRVPWSATEEPPEPATPTNTTVAPGDDEEKDGPASMRVSSPLVERIVQLSQSTNNMRHFRRGMAELMLKNGRR